MPLGLKAIIHCSAVRSRGYPVQSLGTILDEPPTGLITPVGKAIKSIADIAGKRIGYVGEFGKVMIDQLAEEAGLSPHSYHTVHTGMDAANAIIQDKVDAAIGLSCFQQIEVEAAGIKTRLIRIDEAANLGCCCFCSILIIAHEAYIQSHGEMLKGFMSATIKGAALTREQPEEALACLIRTKPQCDTPLFEKIFHHTLPFFSKDGMNVQKDWMKVGAYAEKLGIKKTNEDYKECYTNDFIPKKQPAAFMTED